MEILAALFLGALTVLPLVSSETSPVKITSCEVAYIDSSGIMTSQLQFTNGVTVTATNTSDKPVSSFTVNGSYNGYKVTDSWTGKLLPKGSLSIWKHYQQLAYVGSKADCRVTKVTFADGTTWAATATQ
jgi:hypothetical protein